MLPSARACLKLKGKAFFEIGYNQTDKALLLLRNNNFKICRIYKDLAGINRVIFGDNNIIEAFVSREKEQMPCETPVDPNGCSTC